MVLAENNEKKKETKEVKKRLFSKVFKKSQNEILKRNDKSRYQRGFPKHQNEFKKNEFKMKEFE